MRLKSHVRPNRGAQRHGRSRSRLATLVTVGTVTLGLTGMAVVHAGPALADPTVQFVAVGSDTIQDVMNQFSVDLSGNLLGSYNAVDPVTGVGGNNIEYVKGPNATSPATTCTYTRPNGSGQGLNALRKSINQSTTAAQLANPPQANCIDISRSSSAVTSQNQAADGSLVYIPFAVDAVTGAVGPTTSGTINGSTGPVTAVATNLTNTGAPYYNFVNYLTQAELASLYSCPSTTGTNSGAVSVADPLAPGGTVLVNPNVGPQNPTFTLPSGQAQIDLYIPQAGSGTLSFWAGQLGFSSTSPPSCDHQSIINAGSTYNGQSVEEHNGTAIAVDPQGYFPFSIAQWLSQSRHSNIDRRYGAQLQQVNSIAPIVSGTINANNFPFVREVFNIVQYDEVQPSDTSTYNQALASMFATTNSSLCQDGLTLFNYGFAMLPSTNPNLPDTCGSIANSLRAFDPSSNPV
jgi:hypothetical protein